jgi:hypothetical protein
MLRAPQLSEPLGPLNISHGAAFLVKYSGTLPVSISGQVWDIDSGEQIKVEVFDASNRLIASTLSIVGLPVGDCCSGPTDGLPFTYSFSNLSAPAAVVKITETQGHSFATFGFDNFSICTHDCDVSDQFGVYRNGLWYLDNGNGQWDGCGGFPLHDRCLAGFGAPGDQAVAGDWDGDGSDEVGVYRNGQWYLDNGNGAWDGCGSFPLQDVCLPSFGAAGDQAVAGDWDADGKPQAGVYRNGQWYLDNGNGQWDGCESDQCLLAGFGLPGDQAVAGMW